MGLDMYLNGERYLGAYNKPDYSEKPLPCLTDETYRLGYWRKHANLHGYIVATFAEGVDECQQIDLDEEQLKQLLEAVKDPKSLTKTTGFFFGKSSGDAAEIAEDVAILQRAIDWLQEKDEAIRSVHYRASW